MLRIIAVGDVVGNAKLKPVEEQLVKIRPIKLTMRESRISIRGWLHEIISHPFGKHRSAQQFGSLKTVPQRLPFAFAELMLADAAPQVADAITPVHLANTFFIYPSTPPPFSFTEVGDKLNLLPDG